MAEIALAAAQTLFAALQFLQIDPSLLRSIGDYRSQLKDLESTVSTIKNVLHDAAAKRDPLSREAQGYIEHLKDAVHEADDLFDELLARSQLKQLHQGSKLSRQVRDFFSSSNNQIGVAITMSKRVKHIKKQLDAIAGDHHDFGFLSADHNPIRRRREETCSYVDAHDVIGREDDKKAIVEKLLDSNVKDDVSFLTIVGAGGLGKTTLAQLVFNDEKIKNEFPGSRYRLWVCVSDQDGVELDEKVILAKILESVTGNKLSGDSTLQYVQTQFQEQLGGKKYLLVLDDVWNEDRKKWLDLRKFLVVGQRGSRILVTTRSHNTANVIGNKHCTYELQGLSPENS